MKEFEHQQSAHCETGVMSALLRHEGLDISEPMALGLSSAITFAYIPLVKLNGQPLIAYRMPPKFVINGLKKQLGIKVSTRRFRDEQKAMQELDNALANEQLVGMQASVYWLPYFPEDMRFHFNAHNLLAYGKTGTHYLISDPILHHSVECLPEDLQRARFAKGALAAKGLMYTVHDVPDEKDVDYDRIIRKAIRKSVRIMIGSPVPVIGIKGIHFLARKIQKLDKSIHDPRAMKLYLGHIIRMQEEIGTGGAGFRFIYASFLQEAGNKINEPKLKEASAMMTSAGDTWRLFALEIAKSCKKKADIDLDKLSRLLHDCADEEEKVWKFLKTV